MTDYMIVKSNRVLVDLIDSNTLCRHVSLSGSKGRSGYFKNRDQGKGLVRQSMTIQKLYGGFPASNRPVPLVTIHVSRLETIIPIESPHLIPIHPEAYQSNYDFQMRMAREPI